MIASRLATCRALRACCGGRTSSIITTTIIMIIRRMRACCRPRGRRRDPPRCPVAPLCRNALGHVPAHGWCVAGAAPRRVVAAVCVCVCASASPTSVGGLMRQPVVVKCMRVLGGCRAHRPAAAAPACRQGPQGAAGGRLHCGAHRRDRRRARRPRQPRPRLPRHWQDHARRCGGARAGSRRQWGCSGQQQQWWWLRQPGGCGDVLRDAGLRARGVLLPVPPRRDSAGVPCPDRHSHSRCTVACLAYVHAPLAPSFERRLGGGSMLDWAVASARAPRHGGPRLAPPRWRLCARCTRKMCRCVLQLPCMRKRTCNAAFRCQTAPPARSSRPHVPPSLRRCAGAAVVSA